MVNDLSFEVQRSLFELRGKARYASRINCEMHVVR
jgi:hypothetical protein